MARLYGDDPKLHARALRALENLRAHDGPGVLERARDAGTPLLLGLADGTRKKCTILGVTERTFTLDDGEHAKLEVLFALELGAVKKLKMAARTDDAVARAGYRVDPKPALRLHVSKMLFQRLIDESLLARYTFVDGTVIPCRTRSFGYFEVAADIKGGGPVTLFRHGLARIAVGDEILADISRGFAVQGR